MPSRGGTTLTKRGGPSARPPGDRQDSVGSAGWRAWSAAMSARRACSTTAAGLWAVTAASAALRSAASALSRRTAAVQLEKSWRGQRCRSTRWSQRASAASSSARLAAIAPVRVSGSVRKWNRLVGSAPLVVLVLVAQMGSDPGADGERHRAFPHDLPQRPRGRRGCPLAGVLSPGQHGAARQFTNLKRRAERDWAMRPQSG